MAKASVSFNTPKPGKVTVTLDGESTVLTLNEYIQLLPNINKVSSEEYFAMLKVNIKNHLLKNK